jgi:hypothetical protein
MNDTSDSSDNKRSIWIRGLFMLLLGIAFQVCGTLLCVVTIIQFIIALLSDAPNPRLASFGHNMGSYLGQIVSFLTFAAEDMPYPFSEWPAE